MPKPPQATILANQAEWVGWYEIRELVSAAVKHDLTSYLTIARGIRDAEKLLEAMNELRERLDQGIKVIDRKRAADEDTDRFEQKWITMLNVYMEVYEAWKRCK